MQRVNSTSHNTKIFFRAAANWMFQVHINFFYPSNSCSEKWLGSVKSFGLTVSQLNKLRYYYFISTKITIHMLISAVNRLMMYIILSYSSAYVMIQTYCAHYVRYTLLICKHNDIYLTYLCTTKSCRTDLHFKCLKINFF